MPKIDPVNDMQMSKAPSLLRLQNVSKSFQEGSRERIILDSVSLTVKPGEIVVLLGKSGTGKTTLLNCIGGIDLPSDGQVFIQETNVTLLSEQERTLFRRNHIGFVFQFFNLLPTLSVEENVLLPLELKKGRLTREDHGLATELLDSVGLGDRLKSFPDRLSGGEQQRIAIARALIHDPFLLLADEPTGNLDFDTGLQILDLLEQLSRCNGKTLVMATHSREAIGFADRILTVKGNQLIENSGR
ncbi:ABC transporter ATP-binding protein [Desulfogranum marinum]|uniref:ABC transporter ATP-binding protein n=1 Tax=Desulfogranum marinum TaxID=453220 RepID=UPI0029C75779|nr:ABC transporter ATP-binding protein [Desulfogranum marinum]